MKNYYHILNISNKSSQNRIFKRFSQVIKKGNIKNSHELFVGYLILQETPRKYYDILLRQKQENKSLNTKYLNALKKIEHRAECIYLKFKNEPGYFLSTLTKKSISILLLSSLGPLTSTDLSSTLQLGLGFIFAGIIFCIVGFSNMSFLYFGISSFLSILGIVFCRIGITNWRRELFDKLLINCLN